MSTWTALTPAGLRTRTGLACVRNGVQAMTTWCAGVGRLVWEKGYRDVFDAVAALRANDPQVRVVIVGPDDPDKADALPREELERARAHGVRSSGSVRT